MNSETPTEDVDNGQDIHSSPESKITEGDDMEPSNEIESESSTPLFPESKAEDLTPSNLAPDWMQVSSSLASSPWGFSTSQEQVVIPYTLGIETHEPITMDSMTRSGWDLTQGFPFPCPVVRDPSRDGEVYVPGEILRQALPSSQPQSPLHRSSTSSLNSSSLEQSPSEGLHDSKRQKMDEEEKMISLREVCQQVPLRLSQYHEAASCSRASLLESNPVHGVNTTLRESFAQMDRSARSRFIGLKNSSYRVKEKVCQKQNTTYKEVAEELVNEIGLGDASDKSSLSDADNLKRRVYDVLNVFDAVGLIVKDHKNVYWKGCTAPRPKKLHSLEAQLSEMKRKLERRKVYLKQLVENYDAMVALAERNRYSVPSEKPDQRLFLPFFLVHAPDYVPVDVTVTRDFKSVQLNFKHADFQIHGDMWVLRQLGFHHHKTPLTQKLTANDFPGSQEDTAPPTNQQCPGLNPRLQTTNRELNGKTFYPFTPLTTVDALGENEPSNASSNEDAQSIPP